MTAKTRTELTLDANATWSDDGGTVLVIEYHYRSSNPGEPFFNAPSSSDWWIVAKETDSTLRHRIEIARWPNPSHDGGGLMHQPIFWLRAAKRLIFVESQAPYLLAIDSGRKHVLRAPDAVIAGIVGQALVANAFARSPVPSPDGKYVAVYYTATFLPDGPLGSQQFIHFVSFFKTRNGGHQRSVRIPFESSSTDPFLKPVPKELPHYWRFLWKKDSSGLLFVERNRALVVPVSSAGRVEVVGFVPARSVPGPGGPISRKGDYLHTVESQEEPNATMIKTQSVPGWIPFELVPEIPVRQAGYVGP